MKSPGTVVLLRLSGQFIQLYPRAQASSQFVGSRQELLMLSNTELKMCTAGPRATLQYSQLKRCGFQANQHQSQQQWTERQSCLSGSSLSLEVRALLSLPTPFNFWMLQASLQSIRCFATALLRLCSVLAAVESQCLR